MKTERRHQLETNTLAEKLSRLLQRVQPYSTAIVGAVVAVVLIALTYNYLSSQAEAKAAEGWNRLLNVTMSGVDVAGQLESLADEYDGTPAGYWARLRLADIQLGQGIEQLFRDRAAANDSLHMAAENYQHVADQVTESLLLQRAWLGLGEAYESLDRLDEARGYYQRMIERFPEATLAKLAQQRIDALEHPSIKEFYDWFAQQSAGSNIQDEPSRSDLESLPDEPPEDAAENDRGDASAAESESAGRSQPESESPGNSAETGTRGDEPEGE